MNSCPQIHAPSLVYTHRKVASPPGLYFLVILHLGEVTCLVLTNETWVWSDVLVRAGNNGCALSILLPLCQLERWRHRMERTWIPESLFFLVEESHPPTTKTHSGLLREQEIKPWYQATATSRHLTTAGINLIKRVDKNHSEIKITKPTQERVCLRNTKQEANSRRNGSSIQRVQENLIHVFQKEP